MGMPTTTADRSYKSKAGRGRSSTSTQSQERIILLIKVYLLPLSSFHILMHSHPF
jgi:hypothetical protein